MPHMVYQTSNIKKYIRNIVVKSIICPVTEVWKNSNSTYLLYMYTYSLFLSLSIFECTISLMFTHIDTNRFQQIVPIAFSIRKIINDKLKLPFLSTDINWRNSFGHMNIFEYAFSRYLKLFNWNTSCQYNFSTDIRHSSFLANRSLNILIWHKNN